MPGKCKFQDSWLAKDIYKDWLLKDPQDIHLARCKACCKAIKLQTMGEAALTSHAGGTGHKAAVRKLIEGNIVMINVGEQVNGDGSINQDDDDKEQVAICLQLDSLDRIGGSERPGLHHSTNSITHNVAFQEDTFPTTYITSSGSSRVAHHRFHSPLTGCRVEGLGHRPARPHAAADLPGLGQQARAEALEQQERMKVLEWEHRMKVLEWEQEVLREKRKAAVQKGKAFRMKKRYYRAKLQRIGEQVPPSSSSCSDEDETNEVDPLTG
ncbi:uncharacterized protein fsbp [Polymixia lowei]